MSPGLLLSLTLGAPDSGALIEDAPTWAPIVFAAGAFAVIVVVLILMRQKMKQSENWKQGSQRSEDEGPQDFENGPR